jgi:hypothetical protein
MYFRNDITKLGDSNIFVIDVHTSKVTIVPKFDGQYIIDGIHIAIKLDEYIAVETTISGRFKILEKTDNEVLYEDANGRYIISLSRKTMVNTDISLYDPGERKGYQIKSARKI